MIEVVTDSTAYLHSLTPPVNPAVRVVPLQVVIGGTSRPDDGSLPAGVPASTSRPAPAEFAATYAAAAADGATGIVSVHASGEISGTVEAARLAAAEATVPVEVVDSRSICMGLGFPVIAAAAAARDGSSMAEVAAAAEQTASRIRSFFYVDTLDHLRRGGRIGAAASFVGSALKVKPLLGIREGRIVPLEKVRTAARALSRLEELVVSAVSGPGAEVAVQHVAQAVRAQELAERLRERLPQAGEIYVGEAGAVIGAHAGPGTLGVFVAGAAK